MPYFFLKLGKMSQNLSSAAVVIRALRVKNKIFTRSVLDELNFVWLEISRNLHKKIITSSQSRSIFRGTASLHVHIVINPDQLSKYADYIINNDNNGLN